MPVCVVASTSLIREGSERGSPRFCHAAPPAPSVSAWRGRRKVVGVDMSGKLKPVYQALGVGAVVGGLAGGAATEWAYAPAWALLGAALVLGAAFLGGRYVFLAERKKRNEALPPEMRAIFDRMTGRAPGGAAGTPCVMCGGPRSADEGLQCRSCTEFMARNSNSSIHACGGCGAGFLAESGVKVYTFSSQGVARVFCACCQEHLRARRDLEGQMPPLESGYDAEGQAILARFPGLQLAETLRHRTHQAQLLTLNRNKARRTGVPLPEPMFVRTSEVSPRPPLGGSERPGKASPQVGDRMSPQEVHEFGVRTVAEYEAKAGLEIVSVTTDLGVDPQIVGRRNGGLVFIAVRTALYPRKGALDPDTAARLRAHAAAKKGEAMFAPVGIANAQGKSDAEMAVAERGAGFYVSYAGLEEL